MADLDDVAASISRATGRSFTPTAIEPVGGGCINRTLVVSDGRQRFFVKLNCPDRADMFAAEAEGLRALRAAEALRVPAPICTGRGREAFLVLEYVDFGSEQPTSLEQLGRGLAALHRCTQPRHGWHRHNTIGTTPQDNTPADDWIDFWRQRRLQPQLRLTAENGYARALTPRADRLLARLADFFCDYRPAASLLHGDLWAGNHGVDRAGVPVIFDPAVYYGDRETDLAMTELFGGFGARFYAAYREAWPLDAGYTGRRSLYNLYHVLNHLNLFGGGYLAQATRLIDQLLSEVR